MKLFRNKFLGVTLLSVTAAAVLVACGGGSDTPTAAPQPTQTDPVATASASVASSIGATLIAASADEEVYNLAADIGDTWQLVINNRTNTYVIKVLKSQFRLTDATAAPFTRITAGTIITITGPTGSGFSVQIDTRTKTVSGNARMGVINATVAGSGYNVADTKLLAGNYFFMGATRNVSDGGFRDNPIGSFIVSANGTDITVCDEGIVVNNACAAIPGTNSPFIRTLALKVSKDSSTGLIMIKDGLKDFGVLHVSAGDRGPVLILDRFGLSNDPIPVLRTGVIFAGKSMKLAGTEFNGTFNCSTNGSDFANIVVTGPTYTVKDLQRNISNSGTLQYNKVVGGNGLLAIDLDGAAIAKNNNETLSEASKVLPLSSSLAVLTRNDGVLEICRRAS